MCSLHILGYKHASPVQIQSPPSTPSSDPPLLLHISGQSLPLVAPFKELLLKIKEERAENRRLYGKSYCTEYLDSIYLDPVGQLIRPDYVTQHFSLALEKSGLRKIGFHDLRHSCASLLFSHGVSLKEIQEWLGHSNISTTANIDTHMDFSKKISSANAMIGILSKEKESTSAPN